MSKKSKKRTFTIKIDPVQGLHNILSTKCHCTEEEIDLIDHVLQNMIPMDDAARFTAIFEGKVTSTKIAPHIILDMENGETEELTLNVNHPHMLLFEYLREKYGNRLGTLYWNAVGSNHNKMYMFLSRFHQAPAFKHLIEEDEQEREG